MKRYNLIILVAFLFHLNPQKTNSQTLPSATLMNETNPGGRIDEIFLPPPITKGSTLLFEDWIKGEVVLRNGDTLKGLKIQYNCINHRLLVKSGLSLSELVNDLVKYVFTENLTLFNPAVLGFQKSNIEGLVAINYSSLEKKFIIGNSFNVDVEKANYNLLLNHGDRDNTIEIEKENHLFYGDKAYEIPKRKKKLIQFINKEFGFSEEKIDFNPSDIESLSSFFENRF
ncbi:MAG: hypothetical protein RLN88_13610 [Ekhidna sp.]|uniref:hypothetical protein n=1 Tax=Ekhidna sp. TaxID=2608089 RepID=UPI0032EC5AB4